MQLVRVKPCYFRAFGDSGWINLDSPLVVLYGPNAFGKTSLAEAIEWLLYGKTRRRTRGEVLSQRDYQGSYRNAHAPQSADTYVEAVMRVAGGGEHVIRRELVIGARNVEESRTFVDTQAAEYPSIGLCTDEAFDPIIPQDSLQDFIHSKPKERRDKIGAALGLEPILRFKTLLDKARTRFQSAPPESVVTARVAVRSTIQAMNDCPLVQPIGTRWQSSEFSLQDDLRELETIAVTFLGNQTDTIPADLSLLREALTRRVFDDARIRVPANLGPQVDSLLSESERIAEVVERLCHAFDTIVATGSVYSLTTVQFWRLGLEGYDAEVPDRCPLCEELTLTMPKRAELERRIGQNLSYQQAEERFEAQSEIAAQFVVTLRALTSRLFPFFLDSSQRGLLETLFEKEDNELKVFLGAHDAARTIWARIRETLKDYDQRIEALPSLASNPSTVESARELLAKLADTLNRAVEDAIQAAQTYSRTFSDFDPHLQAKIASSTTIREIDGIIAPFNHWNSLVTYSEYEHLLDDSLNVVRQIENHIQRKQTALLSNRGQEIVDWYNLMNPGASVHYSGMEIGTDNLILLAESFGVQINAAACLSQSQLNCLGLSVHYVRALTSNSPFGFLLMDDPVQSMDDDHCQALIVDVIRELLARDRQVLILSHVQGLVDQIWETYGHLQPLRLRFSDFLQTGPVVEEAETLRSAVERMQQLATSNEDHRRLAVKVVRRSVELLIRAVCRQTNSPSPPDSATAKNMLPFFQNCPGVTTQQSQGLAATIQFANPAPHTQVGWPVPTAQQIMPHVDRIRQTARVLGVL